MTIIKCEYGEYDSRFQKTFKLFKYNIKNSIDIGSSFALYQNGNNLINLYGGSKSKKNKEEWHEDTIVNVYSVSKGLLAISNSILLDRGLIDLDKAISHYCSKFNKPVHDKITLRLLFSHQGGLYSWKEKVIASDLYDWEKCVSLLAKQDLFYKPGEETSYHVTTIGYLIGEIFKSVTGNTIGNFIKKELIRDKTCKCFIGLPKEEFKNISDLYEINDRLTSKSIMSSNKMDVYTENAFKNPQIPNLTEISQSLEWISSEIPSSNCHTNAKSIAAIYDNFVNNIYFENNGISESKIYQDVQYIESNRMDYVLRLPIKWSSVGFILDGGKLFGNSKKAFGHTGLGGSLAFADPDLRLGISYISNTCSETLIGDKRGIDLIQSVYDVFYPEENQSSI